MPSITALAPSPPSSDACNWREAGFALYVHWPFCQAKCPYCDFNSHVVDSVDHDAWRAALVREIGRGADLTPGRELTSVFFGGGTPSLMDPRTVAAVLEAAADAWSVSDDLEVTLEANPTSVEAERFRGYRAAGVNRLSLGVQALDDVDLRRLGRLHSADEARAALALAREIFPRVSADLIYARQHQTLAEWRDELAGVLALGLEHLSLYQLTIESGTVFGARHRRGLLPGLPDEDLGADLYEATNDLCAAAGLPAYEVSNYARPGGESRHNLVYWRAGDWVGVGPGAAGQLTLSNGRWGGSAPAAPLEWMQRAGEAEGATTWRAVGEHGVEALMMGLRLVEGVSLERIRRLGLEIRDEPLAELTERRLVCVMGDRLRVTAAGRQLLDAVLRRLV